MLCGYVHVRLWIVSVVVGRGGVVYVVVGRGGVVWVCACEGVDNPAFQITYF